MTHEVTTCVKGVGEFFGCLGTITVNLRMMIKTVVETFQVSTK